MNHAFINPFEAARVAAFCDNVPHLAPVLMAPQGWESVEGGPVDDEQPPTPPKIGERVEWQEGAIFHSGVVVAYHSDGRLIIDKGEGRLCYRHPNAPRFTF